VGDFSILYRPNFIFGKQLQVRQIQNWNKNCSAIYKNANITSSLGTTEASADGTTHTSSEAEVIAFTDWINTQLKTDADCQKYLPLTKDNMFEGLKDGIILW